MAKTAMIRARVEPELKEQAETILKALGLSTTQAITLFYNKVIASRGLPFEMKLPNETTIQVFKDTDAGKNLTQWESVDDHFSQLGIE